MSWEAYIEMNTQVTNEDIKAYFNAARKYRGLYFVAMKKQLVLELVAKGYKHREICDLIRTNISMVSIHRNRTKDLDKESVKLIKENLHEWIRKGLYPKSKVVKTYPDGWETFNTEFELVKAHEL